jgi:hypothetical protein
MRTENIITATGGRAGGNIRLIYFSLGKKGVGLEG